jgi:allantoicase
MDSWETARHNPRGVDALTLELDQASPIRYLSLSTRFHDGNQSEAVRLLGFDREWKEFFSCTSFEGHSLLRITLPELSGSCSQVRVEMFPDGGLTRLGLYADLPADAKADFLPREQARCERFPDPIPRTRKPLVIPYQPAPGETDRNRARTAGRDEASRAFGGTLVHATNEHYGPAIQVISPFPPLHMFDGLESARSRRPGHFEEVTLRLGSPSKIAGVLLDFTHFVNNNPLEISLSGRTTGKDVEIAPRTRVKAFAGNRKLFHVGSREVFEELTVRTYPDGDVNRIRVITED